MSGKLFMVPTPVGNLDDMSPRAIETLRTSNLILAEDTRTSSVLTRHFGINTPMESHHKFNEHESVGKIIARLKAGETIALISDAGTPGISDPGFMLSRACRNENIEVETLPGPTAFVPALINSGLPCEQFCFEGFLPVKKGRSTRIAAIAASTRTSIIYESPVRLVKTLTQFMEACGADRPASVSREISKLHNSTVNGTLSEIIEHFTMNQPRGECVIVIGGVTEESAPRIHKNKYKTDSID